MQAPGAPSPLLLAMMGGDPLDELGKIERSVRFRDSATPNFARMFGAATNTKIWGLSAWVKRAKFGALQRILSAYDGASAASGYVAFDVGDNITVNTAPSTQASNSTSVYRDPCEHFHLCVRTNMTAAMQEVYVDNVLVASLAVTNVASQINGPYTHYIAPSAFGGLLSHYAFVDGQAPMPSAYCQTHLRTGQWRPKSKAAIRAAIAAGGGPRNGWGANGFFLPFDDINSLTTLGYDRSQSDTDTTGNNWTANNISLTAGVTYDSLLDTPTNNYAVLDWVTPSYSAAVDGLSYGALRCSKTDGTNLSGSRFATIPVKSGKWYAECTVTTAGYWTDSGDYIGVSRDTRYAGLGIGGNVRDTGYSYRSNGKKCVNSSESAYGAAYGSGSVIGIALDADSGTVEFFNNGASQGIAFAGMSAVDAYVFGDTFANGAVHDWNFGQRPFAYAPPAGFKSLCTKNLPKSDTVTISGTFIGNLSADGPRININGCPQTLTINGNAVTFGTHADRLANGFKVRSNSASYNNTGTNTWTATILSPSIKSLFRFQNAKGNP